jgi:hypothetical protein
LIFEERPEDRDNTAPANEILTAGDLVLSVQVLQEFYVQATRSSRVDRLEHGQAAGLVAAFARFPVRRPASP